jgi:hypothetical protein
MGAWDEATKTMAWNSTDNAVVAREVFKSDDLSEFQLTFKNRGGKTVMTTTGVSRRVAPTPVRTLPGTADQVLPALAGAWKGEYTQKIYGGKPDVKKIGAVAINDWIVGKKWLRQRVQMDNGGFVSLSSFEPGPATFRDWFFHSSGLIFGPSTAGWDPATRTMTWTNLPENGVVLLMTLRFVDADSLAGKILIRDKDGKTVFEMDSQMKRTTENITIDETASVDPMPPEMAVLDRTVGDWQTSGIIKDAKNPEGLKADWQSSVRRILGGRVIATNRTGYPGDDESYTLSTFDTFSKAYGRWSFRADGSVMEYGGLWDEKTETLKWHWAGKDGRQSSNTWNLRDPNRRDWEVVTKDALGKTTFEVQATSVRRSDVEGNTEVKALRDLVAAKAQIAQRDKKLFDAGRISKIDWSKAQADLVEARIRLAQAERDTAAIPVLVKELLGLWKEERELVELRVKAGAEPQAVLDKLDARIAESKVRLGSAIGAEVGPTPRTVPGSSPPK